MTEFVLNFDIYIELLCCCYYMCFIVFYFLFFFLCFFFVFFFFFSSRRRHTRWPRDWSSDVCSSDLRRPGEGRTRRAHRGRQEAGAGVQRHCRSRTAGALPSRPCQALQQLRFVPRRSEERRVGKECSARLRA